VALFVFFAATTPTGIIATKISSRFWRSIKQFTEEAHKQFLIGNNRPTIAGRLSWCGYPARFRWFARSEDSSLASSA
jgi:hypothetical protein